MRRGEHAAGLAHYQEAINGFLRRKAKRLADVARIYLAREAALAAIPNAEKLVKSAREAMDRLKTTAHNHVMKTAEKALATKRLSGVTSPYTD